MAEHVLKWQSGAITDGPSRAPARAMLHASGFSTDDLARPLIGIANTWIEIGPCNLHLRTLGTYPSWKTHEGRMPDPFEVCS